MTCDTRSFGCSNLKGERSTMWMPGPKNVSKGEGLPGVEDLLCSADRQGPQPRDDRLPGLGEPLELPLLLVCFDRLHEVGDPRLPAPRGVGLQPLHALADYLLLQKAERLAVFIGDLDIVGDCVDGPLDRLVSVPAPVGSQQREVEVPAGSIDGTVGQACERLGVLACPVDDHDGDSGVAQVLGDESDIVRLAHPGYADDDRSAGE